MLNRRPPQLRFGSQMRAQYSIELCSLTTAVSCELTDLDRGKIPRLSVRLLDHIGSLYLP